ncbi:hypothetical protein [Roseateles puraquae]
MASIVQTPSGTWKAIIRKVGFAVGSCLGLGTGSLPSLTRRKR